MRLKSTLSTTGHQTNQPRIWRSCTPNAQLQPVFSTHPDRPVFPRFEAATTPHSTSAYFLCLMWPTDNALKFLVAQNWVVEQDLYKSLRIRLDESCSVFTLLWKAKNLGNLFNVKTFRTLSLRLINVESVESSNTDIKGSHTSFCVGVVSDY